MKKLRLLSAAGIALSAIGAALCQGHSPATRRASILSRVMGRLVKVDGKNLIISVRQRGGEPKEVTVATDDKTEFNVDFEPGKLTDLKPGMRVSVIAVPARRTRPARLMVSATSRGLSGTVVKVDGAKVVLKVRQRGGEPKDVAVGTDEKTKVLILDVGAPGKVGKLADLKADMRVNVLPETGRAAKIIVFGRTLSPVAGTLVKVDGKNLIVSVRQRGGEPKEMAVATDDKTDFNVDYEPGKLTDLKPGMRVNAIAMPARDTKPAGLMVVAISRSLSGTVVNVDGKNVVLRVRQRGAEPKEVTVGTDEKTRVLISGAGRAPGKVRKLEDLKAGMRVNVLPETGTAAKIVIGPARGSRRLTTRPARPRQVDGF